MTKTELINKIASEANLTKTSASEALNAFLNAVQTALKKGQKITLVGFGTFSAAKRKAKKGRNPKTGEIIKIPAAKVPKFSAGKVLKEAVR